jgi:hypothetical protein
MAVHDPKPPLGASKGADPQKSIWRGKRSFVKTHQDELLLFEDNPELEDLVILVSN